MSNIAKIREYMRLVNPKDNNGGEGNLGGLSWLVPILAIANRISLTYGDERDNQGGVVDTGDVAEDAAFFGMMKKPKMTLEQHDAKFHPDGFNPKTDHCKYREDIKRFERKDKNDRIDGGGKSAGVGSVGSGETVKMSEFGDFAVPRQLLHDMAERDEYRANDPEWQAAYEEMERAVEHDLQGYGGVLTYTPDETASFLKANDSYPQGSIDFVDICVKREMSLKLLTDILRAHPDYEFGPETYKTINETLKKHGLPFACTPCFVEHRRQELGWVCRQFIDACRGNRYARDNKKQPCEMGPKQMAILDALEASIGKKNLRKIAQGMKIFDLAVPDGNLEFFDREANGNEIYKAFIEFNKARGRGSQQLFDMPSPYRGELKLGNKFNMSNSVKEVNVTSGYASDINNLGGIRFWSKSDFDARFMKDVMAIVHDAAELGLTAQSYTKRQEFAWVMRNTGVKVLMSGIPKGKGYEECSKDSPNAVKVDGKYYRLVFDPVEGIDFNDPDSFDVSGHPDIGCNVIGVNDLQMRIAQKDPRIAQIIPLHGKMTLELREMAERSGWEEPGKDGEWKQVRDDKGKLVDKAAGHINFYKAVLLPMEARGEKITERSFVEGYLKLCREKGVEPRCPYGLDKDKDGNYIYTPGYSKYLADGKFFEYRKGSGYGKYYPQRPIKPNFNYDEVKKVIGMRAKEIKARARKPVSKYAAEAWEALQGK